MTDTKKRCVAVTGAAGFVGRHLVEELLKQGCHVKALIHHSDLDADVEKIRGDIHQPESLRQLLSGADQVFNLATALGNRQISAAEFFRINCDGPKALAKSALQAGVKNIVHFSSAGVYGRSSGRVVLKEEDPKNPVDLYEKSKLAGEEAILAFSGSLNIRVIRPGWVFGEGDRRTLKLIRKVGSPFFFIAGRGDILQTPVYVRDLVQATLKVADQGKSGDIFNAAGPPLTVHRMIELIADSLGKTKKIPRIPMGLVYPLAWTLDRSFSLFKKEAPLNLAKLAFFLRGKPLDSSRIRRELAVDFPTDFFRGITETIRWYRTRNWL